MLNLVVIASAIARLRRIAAVHRQHAAEDLQAVHQLGDGRQHWLHSLARFAANGDRRVRLPDQVSDHVSLGPTVSLGEPLDDSKVFVRKPYRYTNCLRIFSRSTHGCMTSQ